MPCSRAGSCSFVPQLARSHALRVFKHLYCDFASDRCARMKLGTCDADVPPDMMPDGNSLSALREQGL